MAERAVQAGHRVSHQYLQELATSGPKEWPRHPETIKGLAAATDTTEAAIVLAFARYFGLRVDTTSLADRIPPAAESLPQGVQDAITELIWTLTRELAPTEADSAEALRWNEAHRGMIQVAASDVEQEQR
jgi:hypothetical protein